MRSIRPPSTPSGATTDAGAGLGLGFEANVAIARQQKSERRQIGIGHGIGEAVNPLRQRGCKLARGKPIARRRVRRVDPEKDRGKPSVRAGQELEPPCLRRKSATLGERSAGFSDRGLPRSPN